MVIGLDRPCVPFLKETEGDGLADTGGGVAGGSFSVPGGLYALGVERTRASSVLPERTRGHDHVLPMDAQAYDPLL
jgi:hypothetical protein